MEWKSGKPSSTGFFWVVDSDTEEVGMVLIISGFGGVLHYRVLHPPKNLRQTEYQALANLNCTSYSDIEIPEWEG